MIYYFDTDAEINKSFEAWKNKHAAGVADSELLYSAYVAGIWEGSRNFVLMPRDECQRRAEQQKKHTQLLCNSYTTLHNFKKGNYHE